MERETPTVPETATRPRSSTSSGSPIDLELAAIGVVGGIVAAMAMDAFSRLVRALSGDGREAAGATVSRYGLGAAMGVNYMLASEQAPDMRRGYGTVYGSLVWAAADEGVLPAAARSKKVSGSPVGVQAYALGAHWVYGATLETCRRLAVAVRDAWERSGRAADAEALDPPAPRRSGPS